MPTQDAALVGILGNAVVASPYNEGSPRLLGLDGTSTTIDQLAHVTGVSERLGLVSGQLARSSLDDPLIGAVSTRPPGP